MGFELYDHPPYAPDIAPSDFFCSSNGYHQICFGDLLGRKLVTDFVFYPKTYFFNNNINSPLNNNLFQSLACRAIQILLAGV